jgi:hypothetical protein
MCADIGRVTGKGIAANIKAAFPSVVLRSVVLLLLIANTLNIAADIAGILGVGLIGVPVLTRRAQHRVRPQCACTCHRIAVGTRFPTGVTRMRTH